MVSGQKSEGPWTMRLDQSENQFGYIYPQKIRSLARKALLVAGVLAPALFLWGCAGLVTGQTTQAPPPPQTFSVSGTISPAPGGNGATVTLSGPTNATTTASSSGAYSFTGLANGNYALT